MLLQQIGERLVDQPFNLPAFRLRESADPREQIMVDSGREFLSRRGHRWFLYE